MLELIMENLRNKKILVTGGKGFVGTNLLNKLDELKLTYYAPNKKEYDLRNETAVKKFNRWL